MAQHTPGPWKIAEAVESKTHNSMRRIRSERGGLDHGAVCEVYGIRDGSEAASNALLIAASPELGEALLHLMGALNAPTGPRGVMAGVPKAMERAQAALEKAGLWPKDGVVEEPTNDA